MRKTDHIIRNETPNDYSAVENLTHEAFWNVYRPGCTEHYVLHCFRDDPAFVPELDLVLEQNGQLVGHILYVRAALETDDGRTLPILTFGPLSIDPSHQKQGLGKLLVDASLEKAAGLGFGAVAITGNLAFYGRSGFVTGKSRNIRYADDPEADYFLVRELIPGFLDGVSGIYHDPAGYFAAERNPERFEVFDAQFPPKEKLKLPGQLG